MAIGLSLGRRQLEHNVQNWHRKLNIYQETLSRTTEERQKVLKGQRSIVYTIDLETKSTLERTRQQAPMKQAQSNDPKEEEGDSSGQEAYSNGTMNVSLPEREKGLEQAEFEALLEKERMGGGEGEKIW
ncbi:hypothetical protein TREMEDRAFT_71409 [Tremella mesenterica DSM 1558]|uniref:uncharacterized protein n=1 Tax=Tremella mesenterica (strain ATCC 24925 / CBS 8224 / DSM 1558 / NBRC 9311 / NRRL Y-6157 / RJB 2259-6 / UBC 559-6) TaxID=578456 RepID=UPI0003F4A2B2|nr:uncharacterized protein TREMEDRAFT_71409 [Tremella mesenterica DSM 1558]EIW70893.1 hypothetical protein TREMEDRAFT_71409 [Tremella mesenterica DSM 1558]